jgi:polyvinyl alcohol dehydrogenase (cytochrome)
VTGSLLIFGDQGGRAALEGGQPFSHGSARVRAVNKYTGELVWSTQVDQHYAAIITTSATVFGNTVFVGVASFEEAYAGLIPAYIYQCCSFRGSVVALNRNTGAILWKTYMAPVTNPAQGPDYSGNAVWGSTPAIDAKRNALYVATGNNYSVPDTVTQCILAAGEDGAAQSACLSAANYLDAVVSLDMTTGSVNWSTTVIPFDTWNVGCLDIGLPVDPEHCPEAAGPDFDFGQAPMLYSVGNGKNKRDLLGVGQKSGQFWSLDADTGQIVWSTQSGVGGIAGGFIWGSATDGIRLYGSDANSFAAPWTLVDGSQTFSGGWIAMDPASGQILWQKANPVPFAPAGGAVSVANGVLYGCAQSSFIPGVSGPNMFAMDAATGNILWSFDSVGACNAGAAIVNGMVYWGFGYPGDTGPGGYGFIAFGLND